MIMRLIMASIVLLFLALGYMSFLMSRTRKDVQHGRDQNETGGSRNGIEENSKLEMPQRSVQIH